MIVVQQTTLTSIILTPGPTQTGSVTPDTGSGMSQGALVAIVVTACVLLVLVLMILVWVYLRRHFVKEIEEENVVSSESTNAETPMSYNAVYGNKKDSQW
ncbi:hypothetical protein EDD86DRAFT_245736 [Gorgonomyces haynaldii]|nr:hypothetical protein EDD86DRAFT_245736 [Gorgonomyces haynaldii]